MYILYIWNILNGGKLITFNIYSLTAKNFLVFFVKLFWLLQNFSKLYQSAFSTGALGKNDLIDFFSIF